MGGLGEGVVALERCYAQTGLWIVWGKADCRLRGGGGGGLGWGHKFGCHHESVTVKNILKVKKWPDKCSLPPS